VHPLPLPRRQRRALSDAQRILHHRIHHHAAPRPSVWGADAEEYNPDHFRPETRSQIPPNAFKPFGSGQRACIGRQFAMQEAMLVLGMLLQRFDFVDFLDYELKVKEGLTIKPEGLIV